MAKKKSKKQKQLKTRKCPCCSETKPLSEFPHTPKFDNLLISAVEIFNKKISENMIHEKIYDITFEVANEVLDDLSARDLGSYAAEDENLLTEDWEPEYVCFEGTTCGATLIHHTLMGKVAFNLHRVYMESHPGPCTCGWGK